MGFGVGLFRVCGWIEKYKDGGLPFCRPTIRRKQRESRRQKR